MNLRQAIDVIEDDSNREWVRTQGQDWLNEPDAKKLKRAAKVVLKAYRELIA